LDTLAAERPTCQLHGDAFGRNRRKWPCAYSPQVVSILTWTATLRWKLLEESAQLNSFSGTSRRQGRPLSRTAPCGWLGGRLAGHGPGNR